MRIVNNLDRLMWERKISAVELAQKAKVSVSQITLIRNNPRTNTTIETMEKICNALGVGLDELVSMEQESQTPVEV